MSSSHASRGLGVGLLCELHAHSRWSDGELALPEVIDLYGRAGFDVLCITDHVVRDGGMVGRTHRRWWLTGGLRSLAHRFELINRSQVFEWVASAGVSGVASGDFHRPEHVSTWKTVLPVERDAAAVVDYLRSRAPAMI